jgi:hypothetical protein
MGCDGKSGGTLARDPVSPEVAALLPSSGRASGHADIHGTEVQNIKDEKYSFTAKPEGALPSAKGEVEVHFLRFTGEEATVHAEITCVSVVGNQAWVGARVVRFILGGEEVPGDLRMIFRVQDLGEANDVNDLASLVFFGFPPGGDLTYCNTRPSFPILFPSTNGNIQVR